MIQPTLDFDTGSDTSRDAAVLNRPRRPRDRERVYAALADAGERGLTDFEIAAVLSAEGPCIGQTSAGKRRLDLERAGLVVRRVVDGQPDRRPSPTGAPAAVWHLARYARPEVVA